MDNIELMMQNLPASFILAALLPEVVVTVSAVILLIGGVFAGDKSAVKMHWLGVFVLISTIFMMLSSPIPYERHYLLNMMFTTDIYTKFVKLLLLGGTILVFILSTSWLRSPEHQRPEFPVLMLFSLVGMFFMVSANDLMSLYLGMELSSLALYVLASFSRDSLRSTEAGVKYFVLGALASGLFLFGASLVYGFSGTTTFNQIADVIKEQPTLSPGLLTGFVLISVAFCFKVSAAPFHMWTPDVYEGAPTPVTAYFSIAPKIAALALLAKLLCGPFQGMLQAWQQIIIVASIASMLVGAFGALGQKNIKRLLAYSSIGHVGYVLVGIATGTVSGIAAILFYLAIYLVMSAGAFGCILMMKRNGEYVEEIADLSGLSRSHPRMAFALALFMFSMAGIPPLAGFFGKMYVFLAALESGFVALSVIGVLASVVACFYYLKVVKVMYFDEPQPVGLDASIPKSLTFVTALCASVTLLFFLMPAPLLHYARAAAEALFN